MTSFLESEFQLLFFFISHICTKSICSVDVVSLSLMTLYKFSKLRPLNYWNSGKSRYTPYPVSIFASQHKNSSNGLFSTVRQKSACSDLSLQVILKVAWNKKKKRVEEGKSWLGHTIPICVWKCKTKNGFRRQGWEPQQGHASQAPSTPSHVPYCKDQFILGPGEEMEPDSERTQN